MKFILALLLLHKHTTQQKIKRQNMNQLSFNVPVHGHGSDGEWRVNCKTIANKHEIKIHHHDNTSLGKYPICINESDQQQYIVSDNGGKFKLDSQLADKHCKLIHFDPETNVAKVMFVFENKTAPLKVSTHIFSIERKYLIHLTDENTAEFMVYLESRKKAHLNRLRMVFWYNFLRQHE